MNQDGIPHRNVVFPIFLSFFASFFLSLGEGGGGLQQKQSLYFSFNSIFRYRNIYHVPCIHAGSHTLGMNSIGNHWLFFRTSINSHYLFSLFCTMYVYVKLSSIIFILYTLTTIHIRIYACKEISKVNDFSIIQQTFKQNVCYTFIVVFYSFTAYDLDRTINQTM